MTGNLLSKPRYTTAKSKFFKSSISFLALVVLFICLLNSRVISGEIYLVMTEAAELIIPSLFPLMVLSRFMCNFGLLEFYERFSGKVISRLFRVSEEASACILIAFLSSFPLGAMSISTLYKDGRVTKEAAETALGPAHSTGPAFPIAVIGGKLFGSLTHGLIIYIIQILSAVIASKVLLKKSSKYKTENNANTECTYKSFSLSVTDAVAQSAVGCVNIVGFVTFGKLLILVISEFISMSSISKALTSSLIEFSSGCSSCAVIGGSIGFALCGFCLSFGGIVSMLQAASYTSSCGLSLKKCMIYKLVEGCIAFIISYFIYNIVFC